MLGFFLSFVYKCIAVGDPVIKRGGGWDSINRFNSAICLCLSQCPKQGGSIFTTAYVVVVLCSVKMSGDCSSF